MLAKAPDIYNIMFQRLAQNQSNRFLLGVVLPTFLALILFFGLLYLLIIPSFEKSFLESKKTMIKELTSVAWSIMDLYEQKERDGQDKIGAQQGALAEIAKLRYGDTHQNYFWIADFHPRMVMHPYSKELIGKDLSKYADLDGKPIFLEFIDLVQNQDSGFLYHTWHEKYTDQGTVSKLSYVKKFEPWGWIVGTGVFLDDVQEKTEKISDRLSFIALCAAIIFSILLFYISQQSLIIEKKRRKAEEELRKSREKYKFLVESATEPIMMILDGKCIYSNKSLWRLLGYSSEELENLDLRKLFYTTQEKETSSIKTVISILNGKKDSDSDSHEVVILGKKGFKIQTRLSFYTKLFGHTDVLVMTVRDLSKQKRIQEQLGESREQYRVLTSRLNIGVFRTTSEKGFRLLEANPEALDLLGIKREDLLHVKLLEYLVPSDEPIHLMDALEKDGFIKEKIFSIKKEGQNSITVSLSLVLTKDSRGNVLFCDGIIEDITEQQKYDEKREDLIVELQSSMLFLNQPLRKLIHGYFSCEPQTSIRDAAKLMAKSGRNAIMVGTHHDADVGVFTNTLLRDRVVARDLSLDIPVDKVMDFPLGLVEETSMVFDALLIMNELEVNYLGTKDHEGEITGLVSKEDLFQVQRFSTTFLLNEIHDAENVEDIVSCHEKLPRIVKSLTDSGVHAKNITRIITSISDTVFHRLMDFALEECGPPPVRFAFVSLGSEGRGEQTLATDQDNAIIFDDVSDEELPQVTEYFARLSTIICAWLDRVGYDFCKGDIMAMNPRWCQSVSVWKEYFSAWVNEANPKDLMEAGIFFDFRCRYGETQHVEAVQQHIQELVKHRPVFFHLMAENTLLFKIPLDFFGNISVESEGEHANSFNIKHVLAMIVGFARIYGIQYSLESTNTLKRLERLHQKDVLTTSAHQDIVESYNYLMQIRFKHQVRKISMGEPPDNHIMLAELTHMEMDMLKKIFAHVGTLRKKLSGVGQGDIFF